MQTTVPKMMYLSSMFSVTFHNRFTVRWELKIFILFKCMPHRCRKIFLPLFSWILEHNFSFNQFLRVTACLSCSITNINIKTPPWCSTSPPSANIKIWANCPDFLCFIPVWKKRPHPISPAFLLNVLLCQQLGQHCLGNFKLDSHFAQTQARITTS